MSPWVWALVLLAAAWAAHWGAEHLAQPLKKLRRRWGFSVAAGGAFVGIAAASPEFGVNAASAVRGVGDIGLGTNLGSNCIAIPTIVAAAWLATRRRLHDEGDHPDHGRHITEGLLRVDKGAVKVQALPYLAIIALFALLTLPPGWRGLQPIDGGLLLVAYLVYLAQALLRGREEGERVDWQRSEVLLALAGVAELGLGAYFIVRATEQLVAAAGLSTLVGGLFITAPMAVLPELFATWAVARSGQVTPAVTSVIGDHAVTMTVAFVPVSLVGVPVENLPLFALNLAFVALMPALYAALIHFGRSEHGFERWQVWVLLLALATWAGAVAWLVFR